MDGRRFVVAAYRSIRRASEQFPLWGNTSSGTSVLIFAQNTGLFSACSVVCQTALHATELCDLVERGCRYKPSSLATSRSSGRPRCRSSISLCSAAPAQSVGSAHGRCGRRARMVYRAASVNMVVPEVRRPDQIIGKALCMSALLIAMSVPA